ncbi:MAG: FkbM family methyltransferase [Gammaproteobacteria bacterium]
MQAQTNVTSGRTADADGQLMLESATRRTDGRPRFVMPIPASMIADPGINVLTRHETMHDGFERITRDIIDAHLRPGDIFIDVGSHWGLMTLSALSGLPGQVDAIAIEPHPLNVQQLMRGVALNGLGQSVEIVPAAAGAAIGTARLVLSGSTMGHSLLQSSARTAPAMQLRVPIVTIDGLLAERPDPGGRRLVIKVDVEGLEPDVFSGARQTLESGRVALLIWERGLEYRDPVRHRAVNLAMDWLSTLGFRHYALPYHGWGGPLLPLTKDDYLCNVFSFAPGVEKHDCYAQDYARRPPYNIMFRLTRTPEQRARVAELCIATGSSDGARWSDPGASIPGADARARASAVLIPHGARVLDLGAGEMVLRDCLPAGCSYVPADLVARSADCLTMDLNQQQLPAGGFDVITLLEVLEYIHDVPALLGRCRDLAPVLIFSYQLHEGGSVQCRRQCGFFSDLNEEQLNAALQRAGWRVDSRTTVDGALLLRCVSA